MRVLSALALLAPLASHAFYLPGVAPRDYTDGEQVEVKVNKLDSVKTQLPYDYYSLGFCRPIEIEWAAENLGEVLGGDDIENSPYQIFMQQTEACKILCKQEYDAPMRKLFAERIKEEYMVNMIMDNLPLGTKQYMSTDNPDDVDLEENGIMYTLVYSKGFPLGYVEKNVAYLNNHHRLTIAFHSEPEQYEGFRIVGFNVEAYSVDHQVNGKWKGASSKLATCTSMDPVRRDSKPLKVIDAASVIWTYDVRWEQSDVKWASRWDLYMKMTTTEIHWFNIVNSFIIVCFLAALIALVLIRTLHRDLRRYNELAQMSEEEREEETGWKLIHGDVFRPPTAAPTLCVAVGTGVQVCLMSVFTLIFACLGLLSPANRGGLLTALLVLFVFMGFFNGYTAVRLYTMFKLTAWKKVVFTTGLMFPGIMFGVFFVLNLFVWGEKSTGAVPFGTLLALLVMWLGISLPLVVMGGWSANRSEPLTNPCRVNNIPRVMQTDIPWYNQGWVNILIGGLLPFGASFIEIFFVLSSVWLHKFYYVFGFLGLVFLILCVTCAEISILVVYFQLTAQDYHWWWRAFLASGSSALYLFMYSVVYYIRNLDIEGFVPGLLYFGYMGLASFCFFLLTGTVGFLATFAFVRKIYSAVKVD